MENIHKIANEVNEQVREQENQLKLFEIADQLNIEVFYIYLLFIQDILIPGRKLLSDLGLLLVNTSIIKPVTVSDNDKENSVKIINQCESKSNHNKQLRWLLLFSDIILISNKTVFGYKTKYEVNLNRIIIQIPTIGSGEQYHLWCIPISDSNSNNGNNKKEKKTKAFCVWFDSEDQMKSFFQLITKAKQSLVNSISINNNKRSTASVYTIYILLSILQKKKIFQTQFAF